MSLEDFRDVLSEARGKPSSVSKAARLFRKWSKANQQLYYMQMDMEEAILSLTDREKEQLAKKIPNASARDFSDDWELNTWIGHAKAF